MLPNIVWQYISLSLNFWTTEVCSSISVASQHLLILIQGNWSFRSAWNNWWFSFLYIIFSLPILFLQFLFGFVHFLDPGCAASFSACIHGNHGWHFPGYVRWYLAELPASAVASASCSLEIVVLLDSAFFWVLNNCFQGCLTDLSDPWVLFLGRTSSLMNSMYCSFATPSDSPGCHHLWHRRETVQDIVLLQLYAYH